MYIVTIENNGVVAEIMNNVEKLKSGKVVKGINTIDSFSFTLLMSNPGFGKVHDFTTLVKVYNLNKKRYDFFGRVLYSDTTMSDTGLITKEVTCENYFGFLCDSQQDVVGVKNWTVRGLLQHIIDKHNSQVEDYKKFTIGEVTVTDPNDNLYVGIQYANTWDTLQEKLVGKLGGELRLRVENGVNYVDYLVEIGKSSTTEIALSHNMKSIKQEKDPTAYVTRLIPLGMKMGENDERLTIEEANNGVKYIDDADGIAKYGIHVGYVEWDDVTEAANLLKKGKAWLEENNRLLIKYSITALDLSLLGLDVDDFDVGNYHPIKNALMGVDDTARIIKKSIDVCEEVKSTIEIGDNFKSMTDIQVSQAQESKNAYSQISKTDAELRLYVADKLKGVDNSIKMAIEGIAFSVDNGETSSSIKLMNGETEIDSAEIKLTGVVTFAGLQDGTTSIDGSCIKTGTIDAKRLNLRGAITWDDLDEDTQTAIEEAADTGGYTEKQIKTFIDEKMVASPTIKGGKFMDIDGVGRLRLAYYNNDDSLPMLLFDETEDGNNLFAVYPLTTGYSWIGLALGGEHILQIKDGVVYPAGDWDFSGANVTFDPDKVIGLS